MKHLSRVNSTNFRGEDGHAGDLCRGEPLRVCSCSCIPINQSINWTIINWKILQEFTLEILPTVFIWQNKKVLMLRTSKWSSQNLCVENKRKEIIDWCGELCSDSWQLCWRMRHLDRNQVTWPITHGSVDCTHTLHQKKRRKAVLLFPSITIHRIRKNKTKKKQYKSKNSKFLKEFCDILSIGVKSCGIALKRGSVSSGNFITHCKFSTERSPITTTMTKKAPVCNGL